MFKESKSQPSKYAPSEAYFQPCPSRFQYSSVTTNVASFVVIDIKIIS